MKKALFAFWSVVAVAVITAGCGGGGSSVPPEPAIASVHRASPMQNSSTFSYGTSQWGIGGGGFYPSPVPSIGPPTKGTMTVTVSTGATFKGLNGLIDFHSQNVAHRLPPVTTDQYYMWNTGATSASLLFVGSTSWQPSQMHGAGPGDGIADTVLCQPPYGPAPVVPLPASWNSQTGIGPCSEHGTNQNTIEHKVYVDVTDRTQYSDGSYVLQGGYTVNGGPETIGETEAVNGDGTGVQDATWSESQPPYVLSSIVVMQTPAPRSSTIPYLITKFNGPIPSPGATTTPAPKATTIPNWYRPSGVPKGIVPSPLALTTFVNKGVIAKLPEQCAVPPQIIGSAPVMEIDETHYALAPFDEYDFERDQYFVVDNIGTVCIQESMNYNRPGYIYQSLYAPNGGYDTFTAYLESNTLSQAVKAARNVNMGAAYDQAGMLALISVYRAAAHEYENPFGALKKSAPQRP